MKWKLEIEPTPGDKRSLTKFAWFPVITDNGYEIWLEKYIEGQIYKEVDRYDFDIGIHYTKKLWVCEFRYAILGDEN